jgi:hypothetical protein
LPSHPDSPNNVPSNDASLLTDSEEVDELDNELPASQLVSNSMLNARRPHWKPFQDRMLAETVEAVHPFEGTMTDELKKLWSKVSVKLLEASVTNGATGKDVIDRTGGAFRAWFNLLMKKHRVRGI